MFATDTIIQDIQNSTRELVQVLRGFSAEQFNRKPLNGAWTQGQVAEHILLLDIRINRILKGEIKAADRPADKKIESINAFFSDLERKLSSPEGIIPSDTIKDPYALTEKINLQRQQLVWTVKTVDLEAICLSFVLDGFGEMSRLEWIYFDIYHSDRHAKQLRNEQNILISESLKVGREREIKF